MERKYGFACDNLIEAEVVTADGRKVTASATENAGSVLGSPWWRRQLRCGHRVPLPAPPGRPLLLAGMSDPSGRDGRDLLRFYRDFMLAAPDEVGGGMAFITAPPAPFVPPEVQGHPVIGIVVSYAGPPEEGERALAPFREFGPPALDLVEPMPYMALQALIEPAEPARDAQLLDGRLLRHAPRRGRRRARRGCDQSGVAAHPDPRCPRRRGDLPRAGRRHGVRRASRAMEHPLPVDVARPRRLGDEHRVHEGTLRFDEALGRGWRVSQLHR